MNAVRAHIKNGAVVLDEPLDLPDGAPVTVSVSNDVDALAEIPDIAPDIEAAWLEEARHRSADLRSGAVSPIPWEEVERRFNK
jgi:hypothetical protein